MRQNAGKTYDNAFIELFARHCIVQDEYLLRVYYYDSPQYKGTVNLPVSGNPTTFASNDTWLRDLAKLERFAVRRGTLGFRGWRPGTAPLNAGVPLTDADFKPIFKQKGVDMRIGLDIANFSHNRAVERIILVSGDQDMIPAMKQARKAGLEVAMIQLPAPAYNLHADISAHSDMIRAVTWPQPLPPTAPRIRWAGFQPRAYLILAIRISTTCRRSRRRRMSLSKGGRRRGTRRPTSCSSRPRPD